LELPEPDENCAIVTVEGKLDETVQLVKNQLRERLNCYQTFKKHPL